ncbi:pyridoxal-dependent decarboxylase [Actinopolyspora mortivallis]|uniref:pyridoxal-dependent decarboxylase n=1 Tax=Actinopolyspora mortivallis TaxID=33906 RepID=UPI0015E5F5BC|nr:pyridoxal-dependent decarboxylase [Actinopolyspora mortivallis]
MDKLLSEATSEDIPTYRNLGTFVSSTVDHEIDSLASYWSRHNLVNRAEYSGTTNLEQQCIAILKNLWNGSEHTSGCSTTGSSEAATIAATSLLRRWGGYGRSGKPNIVLGPTAHLCWQRFCNFLNVQSRIVPSRINKPVVKPESIADRCDENTIGVVATLGSPEFGLYDPVHDMNRELENLNTRTGLYIPLHVDAASGGFVAPFLQPSTAWDFRLSHVTSINASGHKYGLTSPSIGWLLWNTTESKMNELQSGAPYIGDGKPEPTLSFSRSSNQVVEQYLHLLLLGRSGYRATHMRSRDIAKHLARQISDVPGLRTVNDGTDLPVVSFAESSSNSKATSELAESLRNKGWHMPVYKHEKSTNRSFGRIVVRSDMTSDLAEELARDIERASHTITQEG